MATTTYDFSLTGSFPSGAVTLETLDDEIRNSDIVIALDGVIRADGSDQVDVVFKDALSAGDYNILTGVVGNHLGLPVSYIHKVSLSGTSEVHLSGAAVQKDSVLLFAQVGRLSKEVIYATQNFCDGTTWYGGSARITSGTLEDSGDGLTFTSSNPYWIDINGGKLFDEEALAEDQQIFASASGGEEHGYEIKVWMSGVLQTPRARFPDEQATQGSSWDYEIDYHSGTLTFQNPATGSVVANYSYKDGAEWILKPLPDKILTMEKAEIQFSLDINFNAPFVMNVYGYCVYFAPTLAQSYGGPYPDTTLVPLETTEYKTIDQIIDEAIQAFPPIPSLSSGSGRGYSQDKHVFQFHYGAVRKLYSSLGMEVRIFIKGGIPWGGERATATFYCSSETDLGPGPSITELLG